MERIYESMIMFIIRHLDWPSECLLEDAQRRTPSMTIDITQTAKVAACTAGALELNGRKAGRRFLLHSSDS